MNSEARRLKWTLDRALLHGNTDYQAYRQTAVLSSCQKSADSLCNANELQFQIVHQVEELWMKLLSHTLVDIEELIRQRATLPILGLFNRAHHLQSLMRDQLKLISTMSPGSYAKIRQELGQGSGAESPGYRQLLKRPAQLWTAYSDHYLFGQGQTLQEVYQASPDESGAFAIAEAMLEFDLRFSQFRHAHFQIVDRMIGLSATTLKERPASDLERSVNQRFFPLLWDERCALTSSSMKATARDAQVGITSEIHP